MPGLDENAAERVAIVTGGGSAIGRAIARTLAEDGCNCVLAGRDRDRLTAASEELQGGHDSAIVTMPADVRVREDRERLVEFANAEFERVDILVNNAGIARADPLLDVSEETWRDDIATNLDGPFFLSQLVLDQMMKRSSGRVVNIGSVYGFVALNNQYYEGKYPSSTPGDRGPVRAPGYAASKGGLLTLTRELAVAAGRSGVTVNMVSPGMIALPSREIEPRRRERLAEATPVGRLGRPTDVADAVRFLASERANFITGANLVVDGGWSIW